MKINSEITVALLLGGTSPEKEVSKDSSKSVYEALKRLDYNVKLINPAYGINQPENIEQYFNEAEFTEPKNENYIDTFHSNLFDNVDVCFIGLHGKWGEDGTVQSLLELKNIPYTGSNILASALAIDKAKTKSLMKSVNVPTANWLLVNQNKYDLVKLKDDIAAQIGFPFIVKPNDQGSTVGLTICNSIDDLDNGLESAFSVSSAVIIEAFIKGRELTVGVLGDEALPVLEIRPKHGLYDYECKYTDGMSEYIVPAEIPENVSADLQKYTLDIFKAIGCKDTEGLIFF